MSMSQYAQQQVLAQYLGTPSGLYLALFSGDPGVDATNNELDDANYAREPIDFTAPALVSGVYSTHNAVEITFAALAASATVTHYAVMDAASGGNPLDISVLAAPLSLSTGATPRVPASAIVIKGA